MPILHVEEGQLTWALGGLKTMTWALQFLVLKASKLITLFQSNLFFNLMVITISLNYNLKRKLLGIKKWYVWIFRNGKNKVVFLKQTCIKYVLNLSIPRILLKKSYKSRNVSTVFCFFAFFKMLSDVLFSKNLTKKIKKWHSF